MTPQPKACHAPHCDRLARTRGYCSRHYQQVRNHGRLTPELEHIWNPDVCIVEGCSSPPIAKGYCFRHYMQIRRHGRLTPEREREYGRVGCIVEGCEEKKHSAHGYCKKHYSQWYNAQREVKQKD